MNILIRKLRVMDKEYNIVEDIYFLTKHGVHKFLEKHREEIEGQEYTWRIHKEQLWLWR